MHRQLVITSYKEKILSAYYENDQLLELWLENPDEGINIGDIYIGKIKNIVPNIEAAFVEFCKGQMGYYSLKQNPEPMYLNYKKSAKPASGDEILVQVEKENLKTKAYSLSGQIMLRGTGLILYGNRTDVRVSSKFKNEAYAEEIKAALITGGLTEECGFMIRTSGQYMQLDSILREANQLIVDYNDLMLTCKHRTAFSRVRKGDGLYAQIIRRYGLDQDFRVTCDISEICEEIQSAFPKAPFRLVHYRDDYALIKLKGLEAQIEKALAKRVWLRSGGYLVIEPTEALTVIDVNTGKAVGRQENEMHFLKLNEEAALESLRQMRLRNLSGIIIIDFINMKSREHRQHLFELLKKEAARDPVQTSIIDQTALQLIEITRKKTYKSLREQVSGLPKDSNS